MRHSPFAPYCALLLAADAGAGSSDPMPRPGDQVATLDPAGKPVTDPMTGKPATEPVQTVDLFAMLKERCENSVNSGNAMLANQANELLILIHAIEATSGATPTDTSAIRAALSDLATRVGNLETAKADTSTSAITDLQVRVGNLETAVSLGKPA